MTNNHWASHNRKSEVPTITLKARQEPSALSQGSELGGRQWAHSFCEGKQCDGAVCVQEMASKKMEMLGWSRQNTPGTCLNEAAAGRRAQEHPLDLYRRPRKIPRNLAHQHSTHLELAQDASTCERRYACTCKYKASQALRDLQKDNVLRSLQQQQASVCGTMLTSRVKDRSREETFSCSKSSRPQA